jgi:Xaa-Pro aminopeptidase
MITSLEKLQEELKKSSFNAVLVSSNPNIIYLTNYSGFSKEEREAFLFIVKDEQYVLTDARYAEEVKRLIPDFKLIEISSKNSLNQILQMLKLKHKIKKIGIEENNLRVSEYKNLTKLFKNTFHYGGLHSLRSNKTLDEIFKIEKACKLGDKTYNYILKELRVGISEKQLAVKIEMFLKENLADISFTPIVAFGKNSAVPHHVPSDDKLANKQIVLLDFGVKLNNYCSDMTRTVYFGYAPDEFKKMYNIVLESQAQAIKHLKSLVANHKSIPAKDIDKVARDYIISKGYPGIPHSLGHGIGIEVHETPHLSPKSKDILKEGMVFSIEPGIYIPNFGGVRIEDLVVLTKKGPKLLTHSPKNLIEI